MAVNFDRQAPERHGRGHTDIEAEPDSSTRKAQRPASHPTEHADTDSETLRFMIGG